MLTIDILTKMIQYAVNILSNYPNLVEVKVLAQTVVCLISCWLYNSIEPHIRRKSFLTVLPFTTATGAIYL